VFYLSKRGKMQKAARAVKYLLIVSNRHWLVSSSPSPSCLQASHLATTMSQCLGLSRRESHSYVHESHPALIDDELGAPCRATLAMYALNEQDESEVVV
jgi:hypothetical protein